MDGSLVDAEPTDPKPQADKLDRALRDVPAVLEDLPNTNDCKSEPGQRVVIYHKLTDALQGQGHSLAAARWAIHQLHKDGLLVNRFRVCCAPFVLIPGDRSPVPKYVDTDRQMSVYSTPKLWEWRDANEKAATIRGQNAAPVGAVSKAIESTHERLVSTVERLVKFVAEHPRHGSLRSSTAEDYQSVMELDSEIAALCSVMKLTMPTVTYETMGYKPTGFTGVLATQHSAGYKILDDAGWRMAMATLKRTAELSANAPDVSRRDNTPNMKVLGLIDTAKSEFAKSSNGIWLVSAPQGTRINRCDLTDPRCGTIVDDVLLLPFASLHAFGGVNAGTDGSFSLLAITNVGKMAAEELSRFADYSRSAGAEFVANPPSWGSKIGATDAATTWISSLMFCDPIVKRFIKERHVGCRLVTQPWAASIEYARLWLASIQRQSQGLQLLGKNDAGAIENAERLPKDDTAAESSGYDRMTLRRNGFIVRLDGVEHKLEPALFNFVEALWKARGSVLTKEEIQKCGVNYQRLDAAKRRLPEPIARLIRSRPGPNSAYWMDMSL